MDNKKAFWLLLVWIIASLFLVSTVIGMLLFVPGINNSTHYIPVRDRRSTWATIGINLLNEFLK